MKKLLVIGPAIKTVGVGGVTTHVDRLCRKLDQQNYLYDFCDYKVCSFFEQIKIIFSHQIVHLHISHPMLRLLYVLIIKILGKKVILTIHGNIGRFGKLYNWFDKLSIKLNDCSILINKLSYHKAKEWNSNVCYLSAYISPIEDGYLPLYVIDKINKKKIDGKTIIVTNAYKRAFNFEGEEIYGIDFLIRFCKKHKNLFLIISDPSKQYYDLYKNEQFENVEIVVEPHSFYCLLKYADWMIRATATDGDALSIREALSLRKCVFATNRVDRPCGCILFEYNNELSLERVIKQVGDINIDLLVDNEEDVVSELIKIYNKFM